MTTTSAQKTFYAKTFESVLRNYFKCPSKTKTDRPVAYIFLQNKDNKTGYYRKKDKGLSDVMLKSYFNDSIAEEKYLTFFPYINKFNGAFTIGKEHWENFINATDYSGQKTIWGVFCISKDQFILAHNASVFIRHDVVMERDHYIFDAYEVCPQDYVSFIRSTNDRNDWIVESKDNVVHMKYDDQYKGILPENAQCFPLPRIGKEHLFCINGHFITATFTDIANQYHGSDSVDNFITKLRRNNNTNKNQVQKDLRMKPVKDTHIAVIPEDFTETDVIDWQNNHFNTGKMDVDNYEAVRKQKYRMSRKSDRT
jgi:hypothetical protein